MFFLYNNTEKRFLEKEFTDKIEALDYLILNGPNFKKLTLLEGEKKAVRSCFIVAEYGSNGMVSDVLTLYEIDSSKNFIEMPRWKNYRERINIKVYIGDSISFFDSRKKARTIYGFGVMSKIYMYKDRSNDNARVERINKNSVNNYNVIFLDRIKNSIYNWTTESDIRTVESTNGDIY